MDIIVNRSNICGSIDGISSKSYAQRAIFCSILSGGLSHIKIDTISNDIQSALDVARDLGCEVEFSDNVFSINSDVDFPQKVSLNVHESGTTLRFLIPLLAVLGIKAEIKREKTLIKRTNKVYFDVFPEHGVSIEEKDDLIILDGKLKPGVFNVAGNISSQFISGLLIALGSLKEKSEIIINSNLESKPYVDMTIDVMKEFGVKVDIGDNFYKLKGPYLSADYNVEKDWSNALFFLCAGAEVKGLNLLSKQADKKALIYLEKLGYVNVSKDNVKLMKIRPEQKFRVLDAKDIPDSVPVLSLISAITPGRTKVINIKRLRYKESDRVRSTVDMLRSLGIDVIEDKEYFIFDSVKKFRSCMIDSYNDHRIAMTAAIAAKFVEGSIKITDADCVDKSYVGFFDDYLKLGGDVGVL